MQILPHETFLATQTNWNLCAISNSLHVVKILIIVAIYQTLLALEIHQYNQILLDTTYHPKNPIVDALHHLITKRVLLDNSHLIVVLTDLGLVVDHAVARVGVDALRHFLTIRALPDNDHLMMILTDSGLISDHAAARIGVINNF